MKTTEETRVFVADDHAAVREGIRNLLNRAPGIVVVGEASNGLETIQQVGKLDPDVLVLDVEMPGLTGIDVTRRLRQTDSSVRVLILSAYDDQEYVLELLENGASGYLVKGESPERIVEAVRGIANDEKGWISPQIAEKLDRMKKTPSRDSTLTFVEMDILRSLRAGFSFEEIARRLGVPASKVDDQVKILLLKLGTRSWQEALEVATRAGWV
ncbi:MAG: response regulator transcription factor [Chloroflexi bacterium]|nr:response regulator transcription factor [Anaerolineaceae bacterium]NMB88533.1 response regulator transcription factor [Chloroflexota bacterium]